MPDPTPTPTPAPGPEPREKGTRNIVNQQDLEDLKYGEKVAKIAQGSDYLDVMAANKITAPFLTALATDAGTARQQAAKIVELNEARKAATRVEAGAKKDMMTALRGLQKAARSEFEASDPAKLSAFCIGKAGFPGPREVLEVDAQAIIDQAAASLPGLAPAELTAAAGLLKAWQAADDGQSKAEEDLGKAHDTFDAQVESVNTRRRKVLWAVDRKWPCTDKANGAIRRAFGLSPDRPMQ